MNPNRLHDLAEKYLQGTLSEPEFLASCLSLASAATDDSHLDVDRERRCGYPEVVYAEGKTVESIVALFHEFLSRGIVPFATRVSPEQAETLLNTFDVEHNAIGRTIRGRDSQKDESDSTAPVAIVTAGTSDRPVAEEARETLIWMGIDSLLVQDVGVAGPHRLIHHVDKLRNASAVVVIAGMEGALPSVVGGHVDCPVIAVPTSVGYGAAFGGVAALLGMLNSCAANVTVVNIDAGFNAAYIAGLIASRTSRVAPQ